MERDTYLADATVTPMLEYLLAVRSLFDGDFDKSIILLAIAQRTVAHPGFRAMTPDEREVRGGVFPTRGVNVLSIAESTGIARETVRRKVDQLVQTGWVARDGNNLLFTSQAYRDLAPARQARADLAASFYELMVTRAGAVGLQEL
jgi:hypothetical protein